MDLGKTVIIAGGKTGGHLYPGIAVAEVLRDMGFKVIFAGSKNGLEEIEIPARAFSLEIITIGGLKGKSLVETVKNLAKIPISIFQSLKIIKKYKADAVISLGGFAAGPVALAAKLKGKKVFAMEQNSVPGITTKIVSRFADRIYISFPDDAGFFDKTKTLLTGNPVRKEILDAQKMEIKTDKKILAIFGGSQGARSLNELVLHTFSKYPELFSRFFVIHQTGKNDFEKLEDFYKNHAEVIVKPFFKEIGSCYKSADIILCRAGATTIAELLALKKPAIYLPFAQAADNHQYKNALSVVQNGGGEVIDDTAPVEEKSEKLYSKLVDIAEGKVNYFVNNSAKLNAAEIIADDIVKRLGV